VASWRKWFHTAVVVAAVGWGAPLEIAAAAEEEPSAWLYQAWQTDDGLPDNSVTGVAQTADGFLWVATLGGLMRFDGIQFDEFSFTHLPKVPNRNVRTIYLDRQKQLWLTLDRGVIVRVSEAGIRVFGREDGAPDGPVTTVAEDRDGGVCFAAGSEMVRILGNEMERIDAEDGLPAAEHSWLATDEQGDLWFARGSQVGVFRDGRWEVLLTVDSSGVRLAAARGGGVWICSASQLLKFSGEGEPEVVAQMPEKAAVRVMLEDRSGALWLGTAADGLLRLQGNELARIKVGHPEILSLTEDREGNLWVGTSGSGLNLVHRQTMELITASDGLPFRAVRSVCQDTEGWIWTALQNGGLGRGRGHQWQTMGEADGWLGGEATCVAPTLDGGVWIGTRDRGLQRLRAGKCEEWGTREGLGTQNVNSLLPAKNGDLWLATSGPNRMWRFRDGKFQKMRFAGNPRSIRALTEGPGGTIWAGTSDGQILRVKGDALVNETGAQSKDAQTLFSVRCLHAAADGSLWIGYAGGGVGRWRDGRYARITSAQGLHDDYVSQIIADGSGGMWLTGNHGLFKVRESELNEVAERRGGYLRSIAYGRSHGLANLQPYCETNPTTWLGTDGRLWFSTRNGLLMAEPAKVFDNPLAPAVLLKEVKADDRTVALYDPNLPSNQATGRVAGLRSPDMALRLEPGHRKVRFEFTALSFTSPNNVFFRYQLRNFDKQWIEAGTERSATYPQLPAGDYEFRVIACNDAGVWNETGAGVSLTVPPFFYQTWWFRGMTLGLFTAAVIGIVRYATFRRLRERMRQLKQQAVLHHERARIARDMHDEVGSKLTRLSLLSEMAADHPELTREAGDDVREISETAREAILAFDEIVWAVNPRNDTLSDLTNYLCRQAEDFFDGTATQCVCDLPQTIPPMMLATEVRHQVFLAAKEALTNVLKYADARQVSLRLILHPGAFELVIHDDGHGFDPASPDSRPGGGNGLPNMHERMRGIAARFDCASQPGAGTRISFRVPIP
jgi:signal transduction histidine kinase/ligand-binding sensor domain-containing protein